MHPALSHLAKGLRIGKDMHGQDADFFINDYDEATQLLTRFSSQD